LASQSHAFRLFIKGGALRAPVSLNTVVAEVLDLPRIPAASSGHYEVGPSYNERSVGAMIRPTIHQRIIHVNGPP
jgi:hypothetical protein